VRRRVAGVTWQTPGQGIVAAWRLAAARGPGTAGDCSVPWGGCAARARTVGPCAAGV